MGLDSKDDFSFGALFREGNLLVADSCVFTPLAVKVPEVPI